MKRGKRIVFFVNSTKKMAMFFRQIYIYDNNKNIYMFVYKKKVWQNVYVVLIKLSATTTV